jgi:hypothetical protein
MKHDKTRGLKPVSIAQPRPFFSPKITETGNLSLTGFIARIFLVDDVYAPLAFHYLAIYVAFLQRLERIGDFHVPVPFEKQGGKLVFGAG